MNQAAAFRLLASADRQLVLDELVERNGVATIDVLARNVAARRHRTPASKLGDAEIERAEIRLVHTHFPALEAARIVEIDWRDRTVSLTDGDRAATLFDAAEILDCWPPADLLRRPS